MTLGRIAIILILSSLWAAMAQALEPNEILVIVNKNCPESVSIGEYYCVKRSVSKDNILKLDMPWPSGDSVSRAEYDAKIAGPVRDALKGPLYRDKIRCLLTIYGVPIKVGPRQISAVQKSNNEQLEVIFAKKKAEFQAIISQMKVLAIKDSQAPAVDGKLKDLLDESQKVSNTAITRIKSMPAGTQRSAAYLRWLGYYEMLDGKTESIRVATTYGELARPLTSEEQANQLAAAQGYIIMVNTATREQWPLSLRLSRGFYGSLEQVAGIKGVLLHIQNEMDTLTGKESEAAVDSELSMVLFDDYELSKWQANELRNRIIWIDVKTVMVSRLDGPGAEIAKGMIDKAIAAEKNGVKGKAYFDQRGTVAGQNPHWPGIYDKSLEEAADMVRQKTQWPVTLERTVQLFGEGACPDTALYCGWYSLQKYIPSFTFVTGAVGYHIASWEAIHLRDGNSSEWCPSLLKNGITATLGSVSEPYLHAFPEPKQFFSELLDGECLVEAYYRTLPFNSWQIILLGDPLYQFKIKE